MIDLLAIGAHPDDVDLCVGGILALAARAGLDVAILDLSAGERGTRGTPELRHTEALAAAQTLGVANRSCLGLPDAAIRDDEPSRRALADRVRELRPRRVLAPWFEDLHPDHRAAAQLVRSACFLAGLANHEGLTGEASRPRELLHYPGLPGRGSTPPEASAVVRIDGVWEVKRAAIRCFASQFDPEPRALEPAGGADPLERSEARDRWFGARIGARFGEPLVVPGPLELDVSGWVPASKPALGRDPV